MMVVLALMEVKVVVEMQTADRGGQGNGASGDGHGNSNQT